jgi:Leucine-rich repeat (LRR) protein
MKTKVLLVFSLFLFARISTAQYVTIPDASFRTFLKREYPNCFNSQNMMDTTCSAVLTARTINCVGIWSIASLQGIQYFKGLTILDCSGNSLTSLPALPSGLKVLNCSYNKLTSLPALPSALTKLVCEGNQLTSLPALPSGLIFLDCYGNQLTSLPALPSTLDTLACNQNQLSSLPALPSALRELACGLNQLSSLPALPSALRELTCGFNKLTSLPALPSALTTLWCSYNSNLSCLPTLPNGLSTLEVLYTQITCLPNKPAGLTSTLPICTTPCVLGIESSPEEVRLAVSPNPATETCRVEFDTRGKLGSLTLTDALGRTVKSVALQGSGHHDFSVADMPAGLYYLRVNAEGKLLASGKLVVEK